jgi:hypothetical protein
MISWLNYHGASMSNRSGAKDVLGPVAGPPGIKVQLKAAPVLERFKSTLAGVLDELGGCRETGGSNGMPRL